jgi:hypothetical protein
MTKLKLSVTVFLLAAALCAPAQAQSDDDDRRDVTIGNTDRMRSGTNERGDNEMVIEKKPKRKQEVPNMGPIYVVPQVNTGRGPAPVIIPVTPPQPQPQGQPAPPRE